ncbi:MAG: hypothetical protein J2P17_01640, partial [Mycobacterium sp.]|nr:hypothetical protein [Mycobacterium sp.]
MSSKKASEDHVLISGSDDGIAVVGVSCRLPGAPDPDAFWGLLREGRHAITEIPAGRWDMPAALDGSSSPQRLTTRYGAFVDAIDMFDADFFGISPRESAGIDPQQRLMLELSWEAFENAGIMPETLRDSDTGVFVGVIWDDYALLRQEYGPGAITAHTVTGVHRGMIANRISYTLGLHGPSLIVDAAQSSSLVAVHMACESLRTGESTLALVGGVSLNIVPESTLTMERFGGLSPDGRCFTFDARANGFVRGEGGAAVVLKPLSRALADDDRVYCVITGSAVNNDGATRGFTIPSAEQQEEVIRAACRRARTAPGAVQYVELHGTGTKVGDPIEAAALGAALGSARRAGSPLMVGSVKTNIGHLEGAAGIAGLLKTVLSIHHRVLPPSLNFQSPNPAIPLSELNLEVNTATRAWPAPHQPLTAGVSSFGMGGTNCHVVLSEPPLSQSHALDAASYAGATPTTPILCPVSGKTDEALRAQADRLETFLAQHADSSLSDLGCSLATTRSAFSHRAVIVADSRDDLRQGLGALAHRVP